MAQQKFNCPSCGAEVTWKPAKQALVCGSCGTVSPAKLDSDAGKIIEHDLVAALRGLPDEARGWQAEKVYVKCQSCQAISVFDPQHVAQRCDFCGSAQLVPYEQTKASFRPESVLPDLWRAIEPFPTTKELLPYDPGYLAGWVVERYQIDLVAAAKAARAQMDSELRSLCAAQVPGDTQRNLQVRADYSGQTFKHI